MKARDIMTRPVVTVRSSATLEEVARLMLDHNIGSIPVVNEAGCLAGIITESDFAAKERGFPFSTFRWPQVFGRWLPKKDVERIYEAARTMTAADIMSEFVVTIEEDTSLEDIIALMLEHEKHRLPVVRAGVPIGVVTRRDLLRLMLRQGARVAQEG